MIFGFPDFPALETERLWLRRVTRADARAVFAFRGDPDVQKYNGDAFTRLEQAVEFIDWMDDHLRKQTMIEWGITLKGRDTVIGLCGLHSFCREHARAAIGYDVAKKYWGQGITPEAARAVIRFGFEELHLNRIEADSSAENRASVRVLEKLGFQLEGVLKEHYYENGVYHDEVLYALLRRDYFGRP